MVAYVKSKKLVCQVLTNGMAFHDDPQGALLDRLCAAGVDRILLHADVGQDRPGIDLEEFRRTVFSQLERRRIFFGLSVTVYPETRGTIPALMKKYAGFRFFDGILATIARDTESSVRRDTSGGRDPDIGEEHDAIVKELGVGPAAYIPSSVSDAQVSWLR
jgi:hypothetical protein